MPRFRPWMGVVVVVEIIACILVQWAPFSNYVEPTPRPWYK